MAETDILKQEQSQLVDVERLKTELLPVIFTEQEFKTANCYGFVSGIGGGLGYSALAAGATSSGAKLAIVDGVMNDDSLELAPERLHAETVARHLAVPDRTVMENLDQAENELSLKIAAGDLRDPLYCAWVVLEIASAEGEKGGAKVGAFGGGDVTAVALLDQGKNITDRIVPLYFNPIADHDKDSIWSPRFQGLKTRELRAPRQSFLPSGTVILLADDGGMELLSHPWFLEKMEAEVSWPELKEAASQIFRLYTSLRSGELDEEAMLTGFRAGLKPFLSVFSRLGCRQTIGLLMKFLGEKRQFIQDDVALALVELK